MNEDDILPAAPEPNAPLSALDAAIEAAVWEAANPNGAAFTSATATALLFLRQSREALENRRGALNRLSARLEYQQKQDINQARIEALSSTAPDAYVLTDMNGLIREANRAASFLFQVPLQHLIGKPLINLIALQDRPSLRRSLLALQHNLQNKRRDIGEIVEFVRVTPRGGEPMEIMVRVLSYVDPKTGRMEHLQWLIRDITQRVRAETERYRLMVDAVEDYGVFLMDETGRITSWNRGAEKIFGWSANEVINKPFAFLFPPGCQTDAHSEMKQVRQGGRAVEANWMVGKAGCRFGRRAFLSRCRRAERAKTSGPGSPKFCGT